VKNMYMYVFMCMCVCVYIHTHISDTVQTVYELPLLPNYTATAKFLYKIGRVAKC